MEKIHPTLQELLLTAFHIAGNPKDPTLKGLILQSPHGDARFVVTRQQLLDIADECRKAATAMPKPS